MIGALLTGLVAGIIGRLLVPDMWSELSGPSSWLFSLVLGVVILLPFVGIYARVRRRSRSG